MGQWNAKTHYGKELGRGSPIFSNSLDGTLMKIRDATIDDLPDIVRIYNHAIETSVATFDTDPYTVEERKPWFAQFGTEHPLLVCEADQVGVIGFAYYLPFRPKAGYAKTKESTIYVDASSHHCGIGTALYAQLIERATKAGIHTLVAVLGGENLPSEGLHRKFGFELAGQYREVGRKFGNWVDTRTFQKIL